MENNDYGRKDKRLGISIKISKELTTCVYGNTIDELIEGLEMLSNGNLVYKFFVNFPNLTQQQLIHLDKIMLKCFDNNYELAFKYVCKRKEDLNCFDEFMDKFIKINNKNDIFNLAKIFQDKRLKEALLTPPFSGDLLCEIAEEFQDINVQIIKKIIFDFKMKYQAYRICKILQNQNLLTSEDILIAENLVKETKVASIIKKFARNIKGAHILELEDAFINSDCLTGRKILEFACVPGVDIEKLRPLMYKIGSKTKILEFEANFGKKPKKKFNFFCK